MYWIQYYVRIDTELQLYFFRGQNCTYLAYFEDCIIIFVIFFDLERG